MKILCDDKIPYILPALQMLADDVVTKAGSEIGPEDAADADILVVRTRTRCDRRLLAGSRVQLVVTATIGYDHIDTRWLEANGIGWANCPGCNAGSVAQYVLCSLLALQEERPFRLHDAKVGIVGVGHVGTAVYHALREAGAGRLLPCDPPRELAGDSAPDGAAWCSMEQLQDEADVISLHIPLTMRGPHATYHLADTAFFGRLSRQPVFINAARGGVADDAAVEAALEASRVREAIIDTWEREPTVRRALVHKAFIATPHIAGYSADGKANATRMALELICRHLNRPMTFDIQPPPLPAPQGPAPYPAGHPLRLYDPRHDSRRLKARPEEFELQRGNYPLRRERA